ncbi:MAG: lantibiotic dehydratase [Bacteroidetes bacterium]|nr:lantibiotic dehydratase [Bacteroidota bacterium]
MFQPYSYVQLRTPLQNLRDAYTFPADGNTVFQEGIYLSSPEFYKELSRKDSLSEKDRKKLELSFAKYWLRSSSRCTPFGTFAGSALVPITEGASRLELQPNERHRRSLRLDMNYLSAIVQALVRMPAVRKRLTFYTNNSIYETPDRYRYAEASGADHARHYRLTSISKSPYLSNILARASRGTPIQELVDTLMAEEQVDREEAEAFIGDLCESQLLIAGLEPSVTGANPLDQLIGGLQGIPDLTGLVDQLVEIRDLLASPEAGVAFYIKVEEKLQKLGLDIAVPKNVLQADLFLAMGEGHINKHLIAVLLKQASELKALSRPITNPDLQDFKTRFFTRYEHAEVPLCLALDADLGVGYAGLRDELAGGGELIDDLPVAVGQGQGGGDFDYIQQFTLEKYNDWLLAGGDGIVIREEELAKFEKHVLPLRLPGNISLMGSLLGEDGKLDAEHFTFDLAGFMGSSGGNLLGRFAQGDAGIGDFVKDILKLEEREHPEVVYAEIAHLPQPRLGNILLRPVLREYEIPYVGFSGADADHQLPIDDLFVSIRNNEVVLRSRKLNKRVLPRLTTAHNFSSRSLPVYKFLCDLQFQGLAMSNVWDWGNLSVLNHLPRVSYKNLIIHKAVWKIREEDLVDAPTSAWVRERFKLPPRVVYKEGDNELLIDFDRPEGMELFLHYIRRYKNISLEEFLFTEENSVVRDVDGAPYTNELIIPVHREAAGVSMDLAAPAETTVQRVFLPYSEWLYFKVYAGTKTIEHLLSSVISPLVEESLEQGLFERFFFLRFRDEAGGHLRIRFFNQDKDRQWAIAQKLAQALQPWVDNGAIDRVMLDTYKRELERYTPGLMDPTETLFYNDSLAVLRVLSLLDGVSDGRYRLILAMRGIAALLVDFDLSPEQTLTYLKAQQATFFKEFGGSPALQKSLNERYRKHQRFIADHMNAEKDVANEIDEAIEVLNIRSEMNKDLVRELNPGFLNHYIHMFINRLFPGQQRKYELVVYHFLEKYYVSSMAIAKKAKQDAVSVL